MTQGEYSFVKPPAGRVEYSHELIAYICLIRINELAIRRSDEGQRSTHDLSDATSGSCRRADMSGPNK